MAQTPPVHFQLDTVVLQGKGYTHLVRPERLVEQSRMVATWELSGSDSIVVVWSTGFIGVHLQLAVHQDSLVGRATAFHDARPRGAPPDPTASVVATRRSCQTQ